MIHACINPNKHMYHACKDRTKRYVITKKHWRYNACKLRKSINRKGDYFLLELIRRRRLAWFCWNLPHARGTSHACIDSWALCVVLFLPGAASCLVEIIHWSANLAVLQNSMICADQIRRKSTLCFDRQTPLLHRQVNLDPGTSRPESWCH
jgi:hypothetical protein